MDLTNIISSIVALVILEIVLGIDNLVFLSILTEKLPIKERRRASRWGLSFAWMTRLLLLASAVWIVQFTNPFMTVGDHAFSARDLFLIIGGGFLIVKATQEIHQELEPVSKKKLFSTQCGLGRFYRVVLQIAMMDIIFSVDSVLTAIGLTTNFYIMAFAITVSILVMLYASMPVTEFIRRHPTVKMLALSFLILIGVLLIADGFGSHMPRGYLYFAMGFALSVELLNMMKRVRRK